MYCTPNICSRLYVGFNLPASEGWLSTCDHWRIGILFQALKDNVALNFFCSKYFCKALSGWSNCSSMKQWALLSISFLMKFPQPLIFCHSVRVFLHYNITVNSSRLFILKSHNMILMLFIEMALAEILCQKLHLQFSFCFFVRYKEMLLQSFS